MQIIWTSSQSALGWLAEAARGVFVTLGAIDLEPLAARHEHAILALSTLAAPLVAIVALWLAHRLTRRRVLVAVTIVGDDDDVGPIRFRNIGLRLTNLSPAPIIVGPRAFSSRPAFGRFRRESARGPARNFEIPPGVSRTVVLCGVDDFITAYDGMLTRWRKRHARFRVELRTGERFAARISRYEAAHLRDSVREVKRPYLGFAEAEAK